METAKAQAFCFPCEAVEPGAGDCLRGAMAWGLAGGRGVQKVPWGQPGQGRCAMLVPHSPLLKVRFLPVSGPQALLDRAQPVGAGGWRVWETQGC